MTNANQIMLVINVVLMLINIGWLYFQYSMDVKSESYDDEEPQEDTYEFAKLSFDFNKIKPYAIERGPNNFTILSYFVGSGLVDSDYHEFHFYCDLIEHDKLIAEFNKYKRGVV